jgi:hypothetical protein
MHDNGKKTALFGTILAKLFCVCNYFLNFAPLL